MTPYTNSSLILTADIGGTHITTALCDTHKNSLVPGSISRVNISSKDTAENIFSGWNTAFRQSLKKAPSGVIGLGIAMPGPFDYEKGISYITGLDKFEAIYGVDIRTNLADSLKMKPETILFRNDAEALIAGEVWAGLGKHYTNVIGITLGTGFGSAHHIDGSTKDVNWGSSPFKESIADDYFSTRWFTWRYFTLTGDKINGVKDLSALAANEDQAAARVFNEFSTNLNEFLTSHLTALKPQALVICGNIALAASLFLPDLKKRMDHISLELAVMGEHAPLLGVASLFDLSQ